MALVALRSFAATFDFTPNRISILRTFLNHSCFNIRNEPRRRMGLSRCIRRMAKIGRSEAASYPRPLTEKGRGPRKMLTRMSPNKFHTSPVMKLRCCWKEDIFWIKSIVMYLVLARAPIHSRKDRKMESMRRWVGEKQPTVRAAVASWGPSRQIDFVIINPKNKIVLSLFIELVAIIRS